MNLDFYLGGIYNLQPLPDDVHIATRPHLGEHVQGSLQVLAPLLLITRLIVLDQGIPQIDQPARPLPAVPGALADFDQGMAGRDRRAPGGAP